VTTAVKPSDLLLEMNGLEALEKRSAEQDARLTHLKETISALADAEAASLAKTPAEELATAEHPDRPEGAADDEPAMTQEEREASADFEPEPEQPDTTVTAEQAKRLADAAGITADHEEARAAKAGVGELEGYVPGESNGEHVEGPEPGTDIEPAGEETSGQLLPPPDPSYDVKIWQAIVGGDQPDESRVTIKSLPSLTLENIPEGGLRKGQTVELRVTARVTGYGADDKLKHDPETDTLEIKATVEKRTLTVTDAWVVE
jgi:hypothetical protein